VAIFCSEQAGWITGHVIHADGGASLMNPEVAPEIQLAKITPVEPMTSRQALAFIRKHGVVLEAARWACPVAG
jgi:hypothetical protein